MANAIERGGGGSKAPAHIPAKPAPGLDPRVDAGSLAALRASQRADKDMRKQIQPQATPAIA
jgi:hypothetical protein